MKALTPRQLEVIGLRQQGLLHKEIARKLGVSTSTVKNHMSKAYERLDIPKVGFYSTKRRMVTALLGRIAS